MKIEEEIQQKEFSNEFVKAHINVIFTASWMSTINNQLLKPYDISIQQFNILRILRGQHPSPSPLKLITDRMIDKMSNTSRLVEKLKHKKLIDRTQCENNRRQVDIIITESGLALVDKISVMLDKKWSSLGEVTQKEASELNRVLDLMRD